MLSSCLFLPLQVSIKINILDLEDNFLNSYFSNILSVWDQVGAIYLNLRPAPKEMEELLYPIGASGTNPNDPNVRDDEFLRFKLIIAEVRKNADQNKIPASGVINLLLDSYDKITKEKY